MPKRWLRQFLIFFIAPMIIVLVLGILTLPEGAREYSTALYASNGQLLNARLARDEQWRFELKEKLPVNYVKAVTGFEDQHFFFHPGFNPASLIRAFIQNTKAGKVISGGSTLTMQDIRLRRGNKSRSIGNKILEIYWAVCLELSTSKDRILEDYASRAPFGSNVVGLEAACWRYFDKPASRLSWSEAACLAVLPNSPALIYPGKNRGQLELKRNNLLKKLLKLNHIDSITFRLSLLEPIPEAPRPLVNQAPHAMDYLSKKFASENTFNSTLDQHLQNMVTESAFWAHESLQKYQIQNLAILVASTESGKVLAYCGNAPNTKMSPYVDHIQAPRSTGSILKPFLFTGALYQGLILPTALAEDIPVVLDGFQPQNFSKHYTGMTPFNQALIQSLNIPFVHLLKSYGVEHFKFDLQKLGLRQVNKAPSYYGLTLILGGAESCLWDLTGAYASLGRTLIHYQDQDRQYFDSDLHSLILLDGKQKQSVGKKDPVLFHAASIFNTFSTLTNLHRPDEAGQWNSFSGTHQIAWKTGTSYGFRDAWAIGINADYTVGIWVGNSDGEGKPNLLGVKAAAPILFDVFSKLKSSESSWFTPPLDEMIRIPVCAKSGMKPSSVCPELDTIWTSRFEDQSGVCPYHQSILVNNKTHLRVNKNCGLLNEQINKTVFILPPVQANYYAVNQPEYESMPAWDPKCIKETDGQSMKMIYPQHQSTLYIPIDRDGKPGEIVFKLAHRNPETIVYWHLDETYIGSTQRFHEYGLNTAPGKHQLTLIDETGNELIYQFEILSR